MSLGFRTLLGDPTVAKNNLLSNDSYFFFSSTETDKELKQLHACAVSKLAILSIVT